MAVIQLTNETCETEVLKADKPCLVDFYADWCGPCKMLAPIVEEIANTNNDIKVCKVNIDEFPQLAMDYKIMNIPALLAFKDGELFDRSIGVVSKEEILDLFQA